MAFSFMDMFPDTPGAVEAAKGAREIMADQYKSAMGFLEMENALMKTQQAQQAQQRANELQPLQRTMDGLKIIQDLNVANAPELNLFDSLDPSDPNSINDIVLRSMPHMKTNLEANLMKAEASAREATARAMLSQGGQTQRADKEAERKNKAVANKMLDDLVKDSKVKSALASMERAKTPEAREKIASRVRGYINANIAPIQMLDPATADAARHTFSNVLNNQRAPEKNKKEVDPNKTVRVQRNGKTYEFSRAKGLVEVTNGGR